MFSILSIFENDNPLFKPKRILSPSNKYVCLFNSFNLTSSAFAIVDFPDPLSPVNHETHGF